LLLCVIIARSRPPFKREALPNKRESRREPRSAALLRPFSFPDK
jgi:hypothetical protein